MPDQPAPARPVTRRRSVSAPITAFALIALTATVIAYRFGLTTDPLALLLAAITGAAIITAGMSRP